MLGCCRLDEKIRKLDEQLAQHRAQIKKCRPGPAQEAAKRRALQVPGDKPLAHVCINNTTTACTAYDTWSCFSDYSLSICTIEVCASPPRVQYKPYITQAPVSMAAMVKIKRGNSTQTLDALYIGLDCQSLMSVQDRCNHVGTGAQAETAI